MDKIHVPASGIKTTTRQVCQRDEPSPLSNGLVCLQKKPDDQLVLVPLSMLSLNGYSVTTSNSSPHSISESMNQCHNIRQESSTTTSRIEIGENIDSNATDDIYTDQRELENNLDYTQEKNHALVDYEEENNGQQQDRERFSSLPSLSKNQQHLKKRSNFRENNTLVTADVNKVRRKRQKSGHPMTRESSLCQVCGETAGRHNYYGGRSCQSCRAFFRRSVEIFTRWVTIFIPLDT